jgi:hypothetical protein
MEFETFINALQWPAMTATLVAAWLVGSRARRKRLWGFAWFILSNLLWIVWGLHAEAYALILLQVGLFMLNLRGTRKNTQAADEPPESKQAMHTDA